MTSIHGAYAAEEDKLLAKGFSIRPKFGTSAWADFVLEHRGNVNPAFTCEKSTRGNSLAVFAYDENGEPVGTIAARAFDRGELDFEKIGAGRLWLTKQEAAERNLKCWLPDVPPWNEISGRIVQTGGLFVADDHRGARIGSYLDMMARLASAIHLAQDVDHFVGIRMARKVESMPKDYYGAKRTSLAWLDPFGNGPIHLVHISMDELLDDLMDSGHDDPHPAMFPGFSHM